MQFSGGGVVKKKKRSLGYFSAFSLLVSFHAPYRIMDHLKSC